MLISKWKDQIIIAESLSDVELQSEARKKSILEVASRKQDIKIKKGYQAYLAQKEKVQLVIEEKKKMREQSAKQKQHVMAKNYQAAENIRQQEKLYKQDRQLNKQLRQIATSENREQKFEMLSNKLRSRKSELDDLEKQESELLSKMQNTVASHSAMSKLYEETK